MMLLDLASFTLSTFQLVPKPGNRNHCISNGRAGGDLIQRIDFKILEGLRVQIRKGKRVTQICATARKWQDGRNERQSRAAQSPCVHAGPARCPSAAAGKQSTGSPHSHLRCCPTQDGFFPPIFWSHLSISLWYTPIEPSWQGRLSNVWAGFQFQKYETTENLGGAEYQLTLCSLPTQCPAFACAFQGKQLAHLLPWSLGKSTGQDQIKHIICGYVEKTQKKVNLCERI